MLWFETNRPCPQEVRVFEHLVFSRQCHLAMEASGAHEALLEEAQAFGVLWPGSICCPVSLLPDCQAIPPMMDCPLLN